MYIFHFFHNFALLLSHSAIVQPIELKTMIFYYSGCGNSRFVAETMAKKLGEKLIFIPSELKEGKALDYSLSQGESLGFVFPVYAWAPAPIVLDFIAKMTLHSTPAYTYMVCTAGDDVGQTADIFSQALKEKGIELQGCYSVLMPETYINLPGFKLDPPEGERSKINKATDRIPHIVESILEKRYAKDLTIGSMPWLKSHPINKLFKSFLISDKPFKVLDSCVSCGHCEEVCPVGNIHLEGGRPQWNHQCLCCMACYHHCPQNAIQYGKQTEGKGQYYFGHK